MNSKQPHRMQGGAAAVVIGLGLLAGCSHPRVLPPGEALTSQARTEAIRRASVWSPTDIRAIDFKAGDFVSGAESDGAFPLGEWVECDHKDASQPGGRSPKFVCETSPGHKVKVKYGPRNAEVFGEVLATRLFWALGFAADRMYPVRVRCHGCSADPMVNPGITSETTEFDPAAIERKLPGRAMETSPDSGWKWSELDNIGPQAPKGAREQRDALKLLAAFVQHTDSKAANQRLLCPKGQEIGTTGCRGPVLMVSDLGLTFGRSGMFVANLNKNSVSLADWTQRPIWKNPVGCVAHLSRSFYGTLDNPEISEAGRMFLARLLAQLSDSQIRDLFETSQVQRRSSDPSSVPSKDGPPGTLDEWVAAFRVKRAEIVDRRC